MKQIKNLRYPHICYMDTDTTWARRIPLTSEQMRRYHGIKRLCFWVLMLLVDKLIDWDSR